MDTYIDVCIYIVVPLNLLMCPNILSEHGRGAHRSGETHRSIDR